MNAEVKALIGRRVHELRVVICNMTQQQFAAEIGAAFQHTISDYERGVIKPGLSRCARMISLAKQHGREIDILWLRPDLAALGK